MQNQVNGQFFCPFCRFRSPIYRRNRQIGAEKFPRSSRWGLTTFPLFQTGRETFASADCDSHDEGLSIHKEHQRTGQVKEVRQSAHYRATTFRLFRHQKRMPISGITNPLNDWPVGPSS